MVYRQRVAGSGAAHMRALRRGMAAIQALSDNRGFNFIAGFHGAPAWYCWHHQFSRRTPVQARLFLPWHRAYLWWLEQSLLDQVDTRRWGPGERIVFEPYTKEVFDESFDWIARHKIFPEGAMGAGRYEDSVISLAA